MPIKVTCQCGKSFAAKDELAGKAVKCPNCQQPLRIPLAQSAAPLPSRAAPPPSSSGSSIYGGPARPPGPSDSMFDDVGLKQAPAGAVMCPGCASPMTPGAVVCIKCGYNAKLGRRMETVKMGAGGGPGGHDAGTADLMAKAAATIEEDKEEERKKTREGMPWWVYLIALSFAIGFIVMMMILPPKIALMTGGVLIWGLAICINLYAYIRIWIIGFTENVIQGIALVISGFFCPIYVLIYCIMRWDQCGGYLLMIIGSNVFAFMVQVAIAFAFQDDAGEAWIPPESSDPPAAVEYADFDWQPPPLLKSAVT
jgi:hypothetical protein